MFSGIVFVIECIIVSLDLIVLNVWFVFCFKRKHIWINIRSKIWIFIPHSWVVVVLTFSLQIMQYQSSRGSVTPWTHPCLIYCLCWMRYASPRMCVQCSLEIYISTAYGSTQVMRSNFFFFFRCMSIVMGNHSPLFCVCVYYLWTIFFFYVLLWSFLLMMDWSKCWNGNIWKWVEVINFFC